MALYIQERGQGIPVVLLHGLPSPPTDLLELSADFPDCRFIVPYVPGYYPAPRNPGACNNAAVEAALVETLSSLGIHRPVVAGYSVGGYRALSLALRIPVRGVWVLAGFADLSPRERTDLQNFAHAGRAGQDLRHALVPRFLAEAHGKTHPGDVKRVEAWFEVADIATLIEELDDMASCHSLLPQLHTIDAPVVLRAGSLDVAIPPVHSENMARHLLHPTLEIVPGKAHAMLYEDRAGVVESLRRLVNATR